MSKWICATGEFRACVGANAHNVAVPDYAACVVFTPPCKQLADVIAKNQDDGVSFTDGARAFHTSRVLISALMFVGSSAAALAWTSYRRRHRVSDGFELV